MQNKYNYLRISVTDRCNLNCIYCSPSERIQIVGHEDILRYEEIVRFVALSTELGVERVRITGGEPLIKRNISYLVEQLKGLPGIKEVSMTTNGILLAEMASELKSAGLDRVNISLDTLKTDRYVSITGKDGLGLVWKSIMKALKLNLSPVKINVVLFKGINDDEISDFAELTRDYPLNVRFIEYMRASNGNGDCSSVSNEDVMQELKSRYQLKESQNDLRGNGPSKYFSIDGAKGSIGFISPNSNCFCENCNRLRLSSDGKLRPCLFSSHYLDVKKLLRGEKNDEDLMMKIARMIDEKPNFVRDSNKDSGISSNIDMCYIGG